MAPCAVPGHRDSGEVVAIDVPPAVLCEAWLRAALAVHRHSGEGANSPKWENSPQDVAFFGPGAAAFISYRPRLYRSDRAGGRAAVWSRLVHSHLKIAGSRSHASLTVRRGRPRGPRWVAAFRPPSTHTWSAITSMDLKGCVREVNHTVRSVVVVWMFGFAIAWMTVGGKGGPVTWM